MDRRLPLGVRFGVSVSPGSPAARALAACPLNSTDSGAAAKLWRASARGVCRRLKGGKGKKTGKEMKRKQTAQWSEAGPLPSEALNGQAARQSQRPPSKPRFFPRTSSPCRPLNGPPQRWPPRVPPRLPRDTGTQSRPAAVGGGLRWGQSWERLRLAPQPPWLSVD